MGNLAASCSASARQELLTDGFKTTDEVKIVHGDRRTEHGRAFFQSGGGVRASDADDRWDTDQRVCEHYGKLARRAAGFFSGNNLAADGALHRRDDWSLTALVWGARFAGSGPSHAASQLSILATLALLSRGEHARGE